MLLDQGFLNLFLIYKRKKGLTIRLWAVMQLKYGIYNKSGGKAVNQ